MRRKNIYIMFIIVIMLFITISCSSIRPENNLSNVKLERVIDKKIIGKEYIIFVISNEESYAFRVNKKVYKEICIGEVIYNKN